tara:strand:+ start:401 stop:1810 length:1410 start_codon:yes stop_codon:yes gene_type:complete
MSPRSLAALLFLIGGPRAIASPPSAEPGEELSGGTTTVVQNGQNAFSLPLANISRENRRAHVVGNSFFNKNWVVAPASPAARDGLGPLFNAHSCSGCHVRDGRGSLPRENGSSGLLFRLSVPGEKVQKGNVTVHSPPVPHPIYGGQLGVLAIPGAQPEGTVSINYQEIEGKFADGSTYTLRSPVYQLIPSKSYSAPETDLMISPRLAPPVHGLGLLEAVAESEILAHSDPDDEDGDGISGRPNRAWNAERKQYELGRFGWKANQTDLRQQTASAFLSDIGITSRIHPREDLTDSQFEQLDKLLLGEYPELSDQILDRVVRYQQTLAPPARRNWEDPIVVKGKALFESAQCSACHLPTMKTAPDYSEVPELANQTIRPYTDLLLHDMGEALSDHCPDFEARGHEWRTPPLWGIGLTEAVNGNTFFLHDGRARSLEEAILWHGGEAEASAYFYRGLPKADRDALLAFLNSL